MAGRWPRRHRFNPKPVHVRFLVDEVILCQVLLSVFLILTLYIFHTTIFLFVFGATAPRGPGPPHSRGFHFTHDTPQSVRLLWTIDRPVVETSVWQHTTLTTDKHPCHRWDSNPQSQQASGCRPTPYTAWPLGPAGNYITFTKFNTKLYYAIYCWLVLRHVSAWLHRPSSGSPLWYASFASTYLLRVPTYN